MYQPTLYVIDNTMVKCFSAFRSFFKCTKPSEEVLDWQCTYTTNPEGPSPGPLPVEEAPTEEAPVDLVTDVSTNNTLDETSQQAEGDSEVLPAEPEVTTEQVQPQPRVDESQVEHHAGMPTVSQVQMRATVQTRGLRRA